MIEPTGSDTQGGPGASSGAGAPPEPDAAAAAGPSAEATGATEATSTTGAADTAASPDRPAAPRGSSGSRPSRAQAPSRPRSQAPSQARPQARSQARRTLDGLARVCADSRPGEPAEGVLGVVPGHVAAPASVEEAAAVMRFAAENGLSVVPRGAESRLDWGPAPRRCDVLVDTHRLDRVIEHAAGDLVVKTEAGLPMEALAERLAEQGQQLALDLPLPGSTVGGTLAAAAAGPRALLYGSPRDLLIGATIIRADGTVARSGGKVVKNVAGYDLGRLFTGSYGTLGLIVEAAFRLHPLPAARSYVTATMPDAEHAHETVQAVLHSAAVPSAVEIEAPPDAGGAITVGVLLEGVPEGVSARTRQVLAALGGKGTSTGTPPPWWGRYPDGSILIEIAARPTALRPLLATLAQSPVPCGLRGSAGAGLWHTAAPQGTPVDQVAALVGELRRALTPHDGTAVVRFGPEEVRATVDLWGPVPAAALMRRVKDQFDPEHRLSPGRFPGGDA